MASVAKITSTTVMVTIRLLDYVAIQWFYTFAFNCTTNADFIIYYTLKLYS